MKQIGERVRIFENYYVIRRCRLSFVTNCQTTQQNLAGERSEERRGGGLHLACY